MMNLYGVCLWNPCFSQDGARLEEAEPPTCSMDTFPPGTRLRQEKNYALAEFLLKIAPCRLWGAPRLLCEQVGCAVKFE